jgi:glycosyltransferase involved in cell wall biosynthesis
MPKISVILTTFNRRQYLPTMLNCLKNQTFNNYELVLVNNGSTDDTQRICNEYANNNPNVKLITIPKNIGASWGRNKGLAAAEGEYIAFVDDDDRCEPEMLSFLFSLASEENACIAMCGSFNEFEDGRLEPYFICRERFVFNRLDGLRELLKRNLYNVAPPTKLFKRELWQGLTFPNNVLVDDIHVVYKAFERAKWVAVCNKPMYFFKKHAANMTAFIHNKQMTPALLSEYLDMYQTRAKYLFERAPAIANDIQNSLTAFMQSMVKNIAENNIKGCEKQVEFMKNYLKNAEQNE